MSEKFSQNDICVGCRFSRTWNISSNEWNFVPKDYYYRFIIDHLYNYVIIWRSLTRWSLLNISSPSFRKRLIIPFLEIKSLKFNYEFCVKFYNIVISLSNKISKFIYNTRRAKCWSKYYLDTITIILSTSMYKLSNIKIQFHYFLFASRNKHLNISYRYKIIFVFRSI